MVQDQSNSLPKSLRDLDVDLRKPSLGNHFTKTDNIWKTWRRISSKQAEPSTSSENVPYTTCSARRMETGSVNDLDPHNERAGTAGVFQALQDEEILWVVLQGNPYGQYLLISNILMLPWKGKLSGEKHTQLISVWVGTRAEVKASLNGWKAVGAQTNQALLQ